MTVFLGDGVYPRSVVLKSPKAELETLWLLRCRRCGEHGQAVSAKHAVWLRDEHVRRCGRPRKIDFGIAEAHGMVWWPGERVSCRRCRKDLGKKPIKTHRAAWRSMARHLVAMRKEPVGRCDGSHGCRGSRWRPMASLSSRLGARRGCLCGGCLDLSAPRPRDRGSPFGGPLFNKTEHQTTMISETE